MPENDRGPDNTLVMEIGGTKYTIHEYFGGRDTINDIIARRVAGGGAAGCGGGLPPQSIAVSGRRAQTTDA